MISPIYSRQHERHMHEASPEEDIPPDPLPPIMAHLAELREYFSHYVSITRDQFKLSLRNLVLYASLGLLGAVAGTAMLVTAAVLLLQGCVNGLEVLLGGRLWAAQLIVGAIVLTAAGIAAWRFAVGFTESTRKSMVDKYDERHLAQRNRFGHDVQERARHG
jgi:hypothetical protein